jgi:hypothetical protein
VDTSREPSITASVVTSFWSGTKTFRDLATDVRAVVLTGLSLITATAVTATDTILVAIGKLQAQITANLSTLTSHTGNVSNPHSTTATQVNLGNVTNESKATMFTSPTFTGTPLAPTATLGTNTTQLATTAFVKAAIDAAPGGGSSTTISSTPPISPSSGDLWWNSDDGILRIYYNDGTSSQWVDTTPYINTPNKNISLSSNGGAAQTVWSVVLNGGFLGVTGGGAVYFESLDNRIQKNGSANSVEITAKGAGSGINGTWSFGFNFAECRAVGDLGGTSIELTSSNANNYISYRNISGSDIFDAGVFGGNWLIKHNSSTVAGVTATNRFVMFNGFILESLTTTEINAVASPTFGEMYANSTLGCPVFYDGSGWRKFSHSAM